ncbi:MAG: AraC family transcriptional regulator [Flavitalea sp.]
MKPHLLKIPLHSDHSFNIRYDIVPHFYNQWHYHPEIELVYIIRGSGKQFIGDNIHQFKNKDMVLLGSNLPHLWRSDEKTLHKNSSLKVEALVVHFKTDCFGQGFFNLPENRDIGGILEQARYGVRIEGETREKIAALMQKLLVAAKSDRIILLLQVLQIIANSKHTFPACSKNLEFQYNPAETDRLNTIYQYILDNFSRDITLAQIACVANITPHSFCRYFKSRIKKSFSRFLLEVRIAHACNLLAETHKTVADICYESGFNNFSNFNRHFKALTGKTPLAHRKNYQEAAHASAKD